MEIEIPLNGAEMEQAYGWLSDFHPGDPELRQARNRLCGRFMSCYSLVGFDPADQILLSAESADASIIFTEMTKAQGGNADLGRSLLERVAPLCNSFSL